MSAKDKYMYQRSLASHDRGCGLRDQYQRGRKEKAETLLRRCCYTSRCQESQLLRLFHVTLHFMGIKNSAKACNTKCACTKKEPTHVSTIAQKRLANSVFICIDLNIIQTSPSCLQDLKSLDKKPRLRLGFLSRFLNPVNTRDSVCIIYIYST